MRYPVVNLIRRPRMGGMLEDYQNEINRLRDKLYHPTTSQLPPPPNQYPPAQFEPPSLIPPSDPPSGGSACYTRPDGSVYFGAPSQGSMPNNLTEFQCQGVENSQPLEQPPPPPTTTEVDTGAAMGPITVDAGDEVPPPVSTPPTSPGGHAPVVTGIPPGPYDDSVITYPPVPEPGPETEPCPPGYTRLVPGGPCLRDVPTGDERRRRYFPGSSDIFGSAFGGFGGGVAAGAGLMGRVRLVGFRHGQRFS